MTTDELIERIQDNIEFLETTNGDSVECISIENLQTVLEDYLDCFIGNLSIDSGGSQKAQGD